MIPNDLVLIPGCWSPCDVAIPREHLPFTSAVGVAVEEVVFREDIEPLVKDRSCHEVDDSGEIGVVEEMGFTV